MGKTSAEAAREPMRVLEPLTCQVRTITANHGKELRVARERGRGARLGVLLHSAVPLVREDVREHTNTLARHP